MTPFVAVGIGVSAVLLLAMVRGPIGAVARSRHIEYGVNISYGGVIVGLSVLAVCGPLLFSGYRHIAIFGIANLVAVAVLAGLTVDGFASLWCAYAAIALHMRYAK